MRLDWIDRLPRWLCWLGLFVVMLLGMAVMISPIGLIGTWLGTLGYFFGYGIRRGLRWRRVPASRRRAIRARQRLRQEQLRQLAEASAKARLQRLGLEDTPANRIAALGRGRR